MTDLAPVTDLFLNFHDASVFAEKQRRDVFQKIFFRDAAFDNVFAESCFFLIGEKGTGKTSIATFATLNNNEFRDSLLIDFSGLSIDHFTSMRREGFIKISSDADIWKLILLTICAKKIVSSENHNVFFGRPIEKLARVIDRCLDESYAPELPVSSRIVQKADVAAEMTQSEVIPLLISAKLMEEHSRDKSKIQTPILFLCNALESSLRGVRLTKDHIVFIDGIDTKPDDKSFKDFISIVRSMALSAWNLNHDLFRKLKGRKGSIKICLLLRPDIFDRLNLPNQSARVSDNSVVLRWNATQENHRSSSLFFLVDGVLAGQNTRSAVVKRGDAWDYYISRDIDPEFSSSPGNNSFKEFMRLSWYRPRDIIKLLQICQSKIIERSLGERFINRNIFDQCRQEFSDYLFGEVRDFSRFYFFPDAFKVFTGFFQELDMEERFDYESFLRAFGRFSVKVKSSASAPDAAVDLLNEPDSFLQMLYSSNIICWREQNEFYKWEDHWSFRDRTVNNLEPRVGLRKTYSVHYGLRRALGLKRTLVHGVRD